MSKEWHQFQRARKAEVEARLTKLKDSQPTIQCLIQFAEGCTVFARLAGQEVDAVWVIPPILGEGDTITLPPGVGNLTTVTDRRSNLRFLRVVVGLNDSTAKDRFLTTNNISLRAPGLMAHCVDGNAYTLVERTGTWLFEPQEAST